MIDISSKQDLLSLEELIDLKNRRIIPDNDQISLKLIQDYFESYITPYNYLYKCQNNMEIRFQIKEEEFCHLVFGTIESGTKNIKDFKGKVGYQKIKSEEVTFANLPKKIKPKTKDRLKHFIYLDDLLEKPTDIIHFNKHIARPNPNKFIDTDIEADYLLNKQIDKNLNIHLFIRNISKYKVATVSFFPQTHGGYLEKQLKVKTLSFEKTNIK